MSEPEKETHKLGDRIQITGPTHPWYETKGVIIRRGRRNLDWIVRLDTGGLSAVADSEVRKTGEKK